MELVCVRHGRTAWNAVRRFQGRTDVPLDAEGLAQAEALGVYLGSEHFDIAVSSDLSRALATATAIGNACGIQIEPLPVLREIHFGGWEGLTWDEIVASTPALEAATPTSPQLYLPDDGESFAQVCIRVAPVLADVTERLKPGGRALIVSHAGIMHALLRVALAQDGEAALGLSFLPASIMRLSGDGSLPWRLDRVNEIAPPLAESPSAVP